MKRFENIILATDIDGTFVWKNEPIHLYNIEKIRYFTENGGHFLFSSGRNTKDITIVAKELLKLVNTPCVLCNGGLLYDTINDVIENPVYLDSVKLTDIVKDVYERFPDAGCRASYSGGFLIRKDDTPIISELTKSGIIKFATLIDVDEYRNYDIFKAIFLVRNSRMPEVNDYVVGKYGKEFTIIKSGETILEVMPKGVSKAVQLDYLKKKMMQTNPNVRMYCIGDFDNDLDMLKYADVAACPENATDEIKKISTVHLCHCKDGAVGQFVEYIDHNL